MSRRIRPDSIGRIHSGPAPCPRAARRRYAIDYRRVVRRLYAIDLDIGGQLAGSTPVRRWTGGRDSRRLRIATAGSQALGEAKVRRSSLREKTGAQKKEFKASKRTPPGEGSPTHLAASETCQEPQPGSPHPERNPPGAAALLTSPRAKPTGSSSLAHLTASKLARSSSPDHFTASEPPRSSGPTHLAASEIHRAQRPNSPHRKCTCREALPQPLAHFRPGEGCAGGHPLVQRGAEMPAWHPNMRCV